MAVAIMERCAERCALQLYRTSLRKGIKDIFWREFKVRKRHKHNLPESHISYTSTKTSIFQGFLDKDNSASQHERNIVIEMCKVASGISPEIIDVIFELRT